MEDKIETKEFLYRIMPAKRVIEIFSNKELVFMKPSLWKDPFENFLSKVIFTDSIGGQHKIEYLNKVFGQCYSTGNETSLMWDAYTPKGDGIRIKIEKEKFIEALKNQKDYEFENFKYGNVKYVRYHDFISKLKDDTLLKTLYNNQTKDLIDYFFEKRREYSDEREFRVMYDGNNSNNILGDFLQIKIDPLSLIESIRFDPKMKESECDYYKQILINYNFNSKKIFRSLLYKYEVDRKIKL